MLGGNHVFVLRAKLQVELLATHTVCEHVLCTCERAKLQVE